MKRIHKTSMPRIRMLLVTVGLIVSLAATGWCDVPGTVIKKNNKGQASGDIKYKPSSKVYVVTKDGVTITIPSADVERVVVKEPADLEAAIKLVQSGQAVAAIANLERILKDYEGLGTDAKAARWLAESYVKTNPGKAVEMCEKVISRNPRIETDPEFASVYWKALVDSPNSEPKLKRTVENAIASGPRPLVAQALLTRGNMEKKQGNSKANLENALIDGYLRVVVLYKDVKDVQPAALYNAVKCFESLNQGAYADRMRRILLAEYPDDPYSEQIKSGS
jgi:hypothetical protein